MDPNFKKFRDLIQPFQALWNSVRVTCIAVGPPMERKSVISRIALREESLANGQPDREVLWLEPTHDVLIAVVDYPKRAAGNMLVRAIQDYAIDLQPGSRADRVLIKWGLATNPPTQGPPALSGFAWQDPDRYFGMLARTLSGEDRTCIALTGVGDRILELMPERLWQDAGSKLRQLSPHHFDGIEGFLESYLPGAQVTTFDRRSAQIVLPIPLDMEQAEDGALVLYAPKGASQGLPNIVVNFKPQGQALSLKVQSDETQWRWGIDWPQGALTAKAALFYAGEQVSTIELRRWPAATTIRAAVDCYFDPEHKRLKEHLLGQDNKPGTKGKATETFEQACVRLMNLLGVPLVWYGKSASPARNDGAGFVERREERVVVLAECTAEKPEAKFSALQGRAQKLGETLQGEAEILPVVFTQVDPPESVFEGAKAHGIALVGCEELNVLFEMLSSTTNAEGALSFLTKLRALHRLKGISLTGI